MDETRQEAIMRIGKSLDESVTLTGKDVGGNGRFTFNTYDPAAEERAAIVRWLRNFWDGCEDEDLKTAADAIENGDHLKEQTQ
jgi:hypothetical protein